MSAPTPAHNLVAGNPPAAAFLAAPAATQELARPRPDYADVVAWLSGHVAALDRLVYPAAIRYLPQAERDVTVQRARSRDLARKLRRLHAHLGGDSSAPLRELHRLHDSCCRRWWSTAKASGGCSRSFSRRWPPRTGSADPPNTRPACGTARPHPSIPRSRLVYRAAATADRLLDVLDSRTVHPVPQRLAPA